MDQIRNGYLNICEEIVVKHTQTLQEFSTLFINLSDAFNKMRKEIMALPKTDSPKHDVYVKTVTEITECIVKPESLLEENEKEMLLEFFGKDGMVVTLQDMIADAFTEEAMKSKNT